MVKNYKIKRVQKKAVSEHFSFREFFCPGSTTLKLDTLLPLYLEALIYKLGAKKAVITSGYRTPEYSVSVGGKKTDKHTKGMAADVIFYDSENEIISPEIVCCVAESLGFIGGVARIGKTATHIDTRDVSARYFGDETKGTNSIWYYNPKCRSFYDWFCINKPTEKLVNYKVKKNVVYRSTPFKLSNNKVAKLKKGTTVKVVKSARVEYNGIKWYKIKIGADYFWINSKYLKVNK